MIKLFCSLVQVIKLLCFPRYSALAGERKHSASVRQNSSSPISGGGRRGPIHQAGEREKALEGVRRAVQPKVCSSSMNI